MEIIESRIIEGEKVFMTSKNEIVGQGRRSIKDGSPYTRLIKIEDVKNTSSLTYGNVDNTVQMMCSIIEKYHYQVTDLANFLRKGTELETCKSIWNFVFNHVQYKRDRVDREQLSTPARIWLNREKEGTPSDCDDHTVLVGSLLYCLGIPFKIRIAGYDGKPFSHVYPVTQSNICVDTVLHAFDKEAFYTTKQDSKIMQIETLQGHDTTEELGTLGAVDALQQSADDYDNQSDDFVSEEEIELADPEVLNGFADVIKRETKALRNLSEKQLEIALDQYRKEPALYHAKGFSPEYWQHMQKAYDSLKRGDTLEGIIVNMGNGAKWERENLNPVNGLENDYGETVGMMGALEGWFKKVFKKVKHAVRSAGRGIRKGVKSVGKVIKKASQWAVKQLKKLGKFLMKINPIMIIVRAMLRAKVKKDKNSMGLKLAYGMLLTDQQALAVRISLKDLNESRRAYAKFIKKYSFLGGSTSKIKSVIQSVWDAHIKKGSLKGVDCQDDLGQLEGRRSRRRRRRRAKKKAAALAKARALKASNQIKAANKVAAKAYSIDKRANDAAANKLRNRSKWELERMAFLKEMFKSEARMLKGVDGLGEPVTLATTGAAAGICAKIIAWLMKMLKKVGLGKVVEKLKKKRIDNLKNKLSKTLSTAAKDILEKKIAKAENNLVIFKAIPSGKTEKAPQQNPAFTPIKANTADMLALTDEAGKPKTAGMGMVGGIILGLAALGMAFGSSKKKKKSETKSKK
jgi:hypothetical protein